MSRSTKEYAGTMTTKRTKTERELPLRVEYRPIEQLIPYSRNARAHSDAHVAQIAASIKEFDWTNPVLVHGENGIVAGHGGVRAPLELRGEPLPLLRTRDRGSPHAGERPRRPAGRVATLDAA